jgi:hypothetical protein
MVDVTNNPRDRVTGPGVRTPAVGADDMFEPTGQVAAQHRGTEAAMQTTYSAFIRHTVACTSCRTEGMDCPVAAELRQAYRAAKTSAGAGR